MCLPCEPAHFSGVQEWHPNTRLFCVGAGVDRMLVFVTVLELYSEHQANREQ